MTRNRDRIRSRFAQPLTHPLAPALFTTLILVALVARALNSHNWDPLAFVLLTPAEASPTQTSNIGYDGRFAYHIAVNDFGDTTGLDEPNFRYQRIVYPLLVKTLSLGQSGIVPWVMLALNLIAAGGSAYFLGSLLRSSGASPWWGLTLFLSLGYLIAIRFDLLEPLAIFFLLAALWAYTADRFDWAALLLALGVLTKELVIVAAGVLIFFELRRYSWRRASILAAVLLPYLAWSLYLANRFGIPAEAVEKSRLSLLLFAGFFGIEDAVSFWVIGLWTVFPALLFGAWALVDVLRYRFAGPTGLFAGLVAGYALLIGLLPEITWVDPLAVLRWGLGFLVVALLWMAAAHRRLLPYAAALWLPSGLVLALVPGIL